MRTYLTNIKQITSLIAFITALLVVMPFATVSNATVTPGNAVVPTVGVKSVDSKVNPRFNRPNFFNNRPNFINNRPNFFNNRPNFFINRPNFIRPAFNPFFNRPFFGADLDFVD